MGAAQVSKPPTASRALESPTPSARVIDLEVEEASAYGPKRLRIERSVVALSAVIALTVPMVTAFGVDLPGRGVLVLLFVLTVPGVPLVSLLRIPDNLLAPSLAGAMSVAASLLSATTAVVRDAWSPLAWAVGLAALHLIASWPAWQRLSLRAVMASPPPTPSPGPRGSPSWLRMASAAGLAMACALWWLATRRTDLDAAGATGVIGVVGWSYILAVVLVAVVVAVQLVSPVLDVPVLTASAVITCVLLFGFVNVAEGVASFPTGWVHVGFVRFITENQESFYGLDARASWPGFFAASAALVEWAEVPDASSFLLLSPIFLNTAAIAPLLVVARTVTRSRRLAWLAVFIYLGANWYQQDYFAPQATAFLLYLVMLATLLWCADTAPPAELRGGLWTRITTAPRRSPGLPVAVSRRRSIALEGALFILAAAIVVTHQLTPVTVILSLLIFALTGYTRYRRLWLIVSLFFLAWFSYGATDFWAGHIDTVVGDVGKVGENLNSGINSRVTGDPLYQFMQRVRSGFSLFYGALAAVGLWRIRRRPDAVLITLLPAAAVSLVALQSYGGEVVLRVFVLAAPILASLAACALQGLTRRTFTAGMALTGTVTAFLLLGTAARGVNVSFERISVEDVSAAEVLWRELDEGDSVAYIYPTGAYLAARVGEWDEVLLNERQCGKPPLRCVLEETPRFILASHQQDAAEDFVFGGPPGTSTALAENLVSQGLYRFLYKGDETQLLVLNADEG